MFDHPKRAYRHSRLFGHLPQRLRGVEKGGGNFPQTAHLSEYDPKNEHRYPVFTLGKSPKYGWSVCKLTHYTREGYIDRLAYIAGNEENICLPEPKDEKRAERTETSVQGGFIIVDYSEKAIAVFGDTKPVKTPFTHSGDAQRTADA